MAWSIQLPDLPDHGIRSHRAKEKRGTFSHGRSIEERPHKVETRQEFGHFEADTVLSGKRKGQAVLELASQFQDKLKTLTVNHGKEFANYQAIERRTVHRFILPMPIHRMKEAVMRTVTEFCGALFPKAKPLKN